MEEVNQSLLMKEEKLGVFGILKESLKIPCKNPKFILLTLLTSFPLVFIMLLHEIILQTTMIETKTHLTPIRRNSDPFFYRYSVFSITDQRYYFSESPFDMLIKLLQDMSPKVFELGFLYFVPLHLLDLINTIVTVNSASAIYAEKPVNIKDMLHRLVEGKRFKGPLITSIYVLSLNSFVLLGLIWAVTNSIFPSFGTFFEVVYALFSIVLLGKWIEWSAIWNMSIVLSVLEEKHGIEAFGLSGYFSRGNKRRGLYLMLVFFAWRIALRLSCLYVGGNEKWGALAATSILSCMGNVMKWVVCTVYFYDCKKRVLEKKVDLEEGKKLDMSIVASL